MNEADAQRFSLPVELCEVISSACCPIKWFGDSERARRDEVLASGVCQSRGVRLRHDLLGRLGISDARRLFRQWEPLFLSDDPRRRCDWSLGRLPIQFCLGPWADNSADGLGTVLSRFRSRWVVGEASARLGAFGAKCSGMIVSLPNQSPRSRLRPRCCFGAVPGRSAASRLSLHVSASAEACS